MRYASLYDRLVANTVEDEDGCWIWTGRTSRDGYPIFTQREPGKPHPMARRAHRAMLEIVTGWLFPFDEAGHWRCYKPACIRPHCLRIETPAENLAARRGYASNAQGRMIPILYPTPERELDEHLDRYFATWQAK